MQADLFPQLAGEPWQHDKLRRCYRQVRNRFSPSQLACRTNYQRFERPRYSLAEFARAIGLPPSETVSVDRIDNDRGYDLHNIRWASRYVQARNSAVSKYRPWRIFGHVICGKAIGPVFGLCGDWASNRRSERLLRGLDIEAAMLEVEQIAEQRLVAAGLGFCDIVELAKRSTGEL